MSDHERALLAGVSDRIHYNDGMYTGDGAHYFKVGLSAIHCIDDVLVRAGSPEIANILDLPCGGGRVLRFLSRRFPKAEITGCDLQREAVDFCARELGATPHYSIPDFDQLSLDAIYDLIWCGSLVTHLNKDDIVSLLKFFKRHLAPRGVLIFTTMGDYVARKRLPGREFDYGLAETLIPRVLADYERTGFGFGGYPEGTYDVSTTCGVTLTSPAWIRSCVESVGGLREIYFAPRGWDNHQDVFGFVSEG